MGSQGGMGGGVERYLVTTPSRRGLNTKRLTCATLSSVGVSSMWWEAPRDCRRGNKAVRDVFQRRNSGAVLLLDYVPEETGISFRKGRGNSAGKQ